MFAPFMADTWITATAVAVVAALVGFFVVLRGAAFTAHAVPNAAFAGAAGAGLLGLNTLLGLGVFSLGGALGIGLLSRRGRHDAVTALIVAMMLGLGALFLSWSSEYAPEIYSLLFGEVLGVGAGQAELTVLLGALTLLVLAAIYRPLLLASVLPEVAEARGVRAGRLDMTFLALVALATTTAVPVVGALLMFSLMVGPPAAARVLTRHPLPAMLLGTALALVTAWGAIALSYQTEWPIGFFVGTGAAAWYVLARLIALGRARMRAARRGGGAAARQAVRA
jgi:zinc/manganese transport system permease protein